ncbi:MAG: 23S rRNA (adenine(2503)-C(2))-methyltransferase RlmN [Candidatus Cloacimonetes bacterium]|nr:23S rRNA (adenine(2503)-C(2))-methyltransferase RlmN [Candidatus Cloacimonadota bacterium]MCK9241751.1 23S rRNA (adenine(2503)-C(2))-methyltransferase RlmN [Candidatus Cloacimonadota bacterium]
MLINIFSFRPEELESRLKEHFPAFRYRQLMHWLYEKLVFDPQQMTDLPASMKTFLFRNFSFILPQIDAVQTADDGTAKYRLRLEDGMVIEMVLMPNDKKRTLCVSSQVGCARACAFCATGKMGLKRNLQVHEIVGQILLAASICQPQRLSNLVFMGMGEPLDNLDSVLASLRIIQAENSLTFSPRRTTVSSCGLPEQIRQLADSKVRTKLAISLNSAIDAKRDILMPVNKAHPLPELKRALIYYLNKVNYKVTFEYILIPEVNMGAQDIKALKRFVGDLSCNINFIPYNSVPGLLYHSPSDQEIEGFLSRAQVLNQPITLRRSKGAGILGACGQLAGT